MWDKEKGNNSIPPYFKCLNLNATIKVSVCLARQAALNKYEKPVYEMCSDCKAGRKIKLGIDLKDINGVKELDPETLETYLAIEKRTLKSTASAPKDIPKSVEDKKGEPPIEEKICSPENEEKEPETSIKEEEVVTGKDPESTDEPSKKAIRSKHSKSGRTKTLIGSNPSFICKNCTLESTGVKTLDMCIPCYSTHYRWKDSENHDEMMLKRKERALGINTTKKEPKIYTPENKEPIKTGEDKLNKIILTFSKAFSKVYMQLFELMAVERREDIPTYIMHLIEKEYYRSPLIAGGRKQKYLKSQI